MPSLSILNCLLDPIFIFGLNMGVAGASLATAISKLVSFAILIYPYITRRSMLHLNVKNIRFSRDIVTNVVSVGSSSLFRNGLAVVAAIMLNDLAGNISDSVLAGVGVCTKVMMFPFSIILGFGSGFQPVAGFNWGAKRYDRVKQCYDFASWVSIIGAVIMAAGLGIFSDQLIQIFAGTDPEMREIGGLCIRLQCIALPIHAWVAMVNMLCTGLGNAKGAFLLATARQGTCFIPILYPLAFLFGANGIASAQALADVLTLALAIPLAMATLKTIKAAQNTEDLPV
jgi:Na+-driven multidrug efflux pump